MLDESLKKTVQDAIDDAFRWKPGMAPQPSAGWAEKIGQWFGLAHTASDTGQIHSQAPAKVPEVRVYKGYEFTKGDDGEWHRGDKVQ